MRKKVIFLVLALIAMVAGITFSSCSKDDEPQSVDNYYLVLVSVETNLADANGQSVATALIKEFIAASAGVDSNGRAFIGSTTKEKAIKAFDKSVDNYRKAIGEGYVGKMPEGGLIEYNLALQTQSGSIVKTSTITVTNSGAFSN